MARTLKALYDGIDSVPPKSAWIRRVADAAKVSEFTVRMWIAGRQKPQEGIQVLVAKELGVPVKELFQDDDRKDGKNSYKPEISTEL